MLIEALAGDVHIVLSDTQPAFSNPTFHKLTDRMRLYLPRLDLNVWAIAKNLNSQAVVTQSYTSLESSPWGQHAENVIYQTFGDVVSIAQKGKDLLKFGRSEQVQLNTATTLMTLPSGTYNETYIETNGITTISSASTLDTQEIQYEGHTVDGSGNKTFFVDTVTLDGRNQVTLPTPAARLNRAFNNNSVDLVGPIYFYENDTSTNGVPDTDSGVHLMIDAGKNQSEKLATCLSQEDYWLISAVYLDVLEKSSTFADATVEVRPLGGVFRPIFEIGASNAGTFRSFTPFLIIPPNSDVRVRSTASSNNAEISGGIHGKLAKVVL